MKFVRGFKASCEQLVEQLRNELALSALQPIDMKSLAEHLGIPVWPLRHMLEAAHESRACVNVTEIYRRVSAFTFFDGSRRRIVYNDEHALPRHRSNLAHEFAHALLQHPARDSGIGTQAEEENEAEAAWLSGVILLPAHQARHIAVTRMSTETAERQFEISSEMLRYRLNVTGAAKMAA